MESVLQLDHRGYCNRTSVLSYSIISKYKPTYPPEHYPSVAPYAALTKFFSKLIKDRKIHMRLLKQLLYPEYLNKMNLSLVKIRHHKTEYVIMTKPATECRFSIVRCDSNDSDTDSVESEKSCTSLRQSALCSNSSSSCSNPFGYIRYYNPHNDTTKYESFIDYGELIHNSEAKMVDDSDHIDKKASITVISTAKVELIHQISSESSEASSHVPQKPSYLLACEDLVNIDENLPFGDTKTRKLFIPITRQSLPSKFVCNKFSDNNLTTIDIPQWQSNSDNCLNKGNDFSTHSSSIALELNNTLPLPDRVVAELLYNLDAPVKSNTLTKSESVDSDKSFKTVIKPPTVLRSNEPSRTVKLSKENVDLFKHSIKSDKSKSRTSIHIQDLNRIRKCVSSHFIQMGFESNFGTELSSSCHSPRSSDSGMAGSCTLNSPDFAAVDQERCSIDLTTESFLKQYHHTFEHCTDDKILSLSEIEARDFNSQCPCTSPFGSTPRTSCDTPVSGKIHDSRSSVHSDLPNHLHPKLLNAEPPRCIEKWEPAQKSKSLDCLSDSNSVNETNNGKAEIFKSGLYAHWWLKAKIPAYVVKGIYEETKSSNTGKGFLIFCQLNDAFFFT